MNCAECKLEHRMAQAEQELQENRARHRSMHEQMEVLAVENARRAEQYASILRLLGDLRTDVTDLRGKPAKRWEQLITALLQWTVTAALAYFIAG